MVSVRMASTARKSTRALALPGLIRKRGVAIIAFLWLAVVICAAVFPQAFTDLDPNRQDIERRCLPPSFRERAGVTNVLGTDQLGRDVFSRIVWGSRLSLWVGVASAVLAVMIGVPLGLVCGYYRGIIDQLVMQLADIQLSFPSMVLAIALVAVLGPSTRNVILVLAIGGWVQHARVVRGQVLALREKEFVEAARAIGAHDGRIIVRHLLPNILPNVFVIGTFQVAQAIVTEAALTFLGLGVSRLVPSWGGMLSDAQDYLVAAGWMATIPGLVIAITVLSINILGDTCREVLDPRLRR